MSDEANNLSAAATSFVPGGPPADQVEKEIADEIYADDMDELVADMNASSVGSQTAGAAAAAASSTLPAHLVSQAAEFWFPECRDCACCKGYKHGCSCGGLCTCSGGTSAAAPGGASSLNAASSAPQRRYSNEKQGKKKPCRFFQSGSCRFGDKCRFSHAM